MFFYIIFNKKGLFSILKRKTLFHINVLFSVKFLQAYTASHQKQTAFRSLYRNSLIPVYMPDSSATLIVLMIHLGSFLASFEKLIVNVDPYIIPLNASYSKTPAASCSNAYAQK